MKNFLVHELNRLKERYNDLSRKLFLIYHDARVRVLDFILNR